MEESRGTTILVGDMSGHATWKKRSGCASHSITKEMVIVRFFQAEEVAMEAYFLERIKDGRSVEWRLEARALESDCLPSDPYSAALKL